MAFPQTNRYQVSFRHADTGLTPTFTMFRRADTHAELTKPVIYEEANGTYYFDYVWAASTDPDVTFEVDGGASIPTPEIRYVKGTIRVPVVASSGGGGGGGGGGWSVG